MAHSVVAYRCSCVFAEAPSVFSFHVLLLAHTAVLSHTPFADLHNWFVNTHPASIVRYCERGHDHPSLSYIRKQLQSGYILVTHEHNGEECELAMSVDSNAVRWEPSLLSFEGAATVDDSHYHITVRLPLPSLVGTAHAELAADPDPDPVQ